MMPVLFRRLWGNCRGVAAVEFALTLPIMITALLGTVEIANLVKSYGKVVSAAQSVADLTAQSSSLTTAQMDSIRTAAQRVLDPLVTNATNLGIDVVSVGFDAGGSPSQLWRYQWGAVSGSPSLSGAAGLGAAGESVIMVRLSYVCVPVLHHIVPSKTFSEMSYTRPRLVRRIALNGVGG
ncbi:Flp pilus assembly protein TadG [Paramagnetospirillum caucaseum]|uniref:Flp pilus assembly protein TadG n=1 Tax=Paramagnetospirillum caucaseum TaxID=1244869 RepID=M3A7B0_9PROT|nr:TadE/TadG family type IV pilus assembly protein [Paramagnetospirillum caucaseum]EME68663.1 Flp pilus assembly protein TadG [Paramagnetospirillum caucaseum]